MSEVKQCEMNSDKVAELLIRLYADYERYSDRLKYPRINPKYAEAVAIAIRMLVDE